MTTMTNHTLLSRLNGRKPMGKSSGFTLIEVMVSIVIFSIGLIGIARLQVVAKQSNYDAVQRVAATSLAQDMLARMRSNHSELGTYVSNNGETIILGNANAATPANTCGNSGNPCSTLQLATHDLWEIERAMIGIAEQDTDGNNTGGLVSPTMCITGPAAGTSGVYTVAIAWRGKAALTNSIRSDCGNDRDLYGDANVYRRVIVMETFITSI